MTDLISRQALMKEFSDFVRASNNSDFARTPTWNDAVSLVESMQSAQQWIPCSERLPEEEEDFLVTDGESMAVGYYRRDAGAWDSADFGWIENREKGYGINEVIAWMPLPEPYKERREE